MTTKAKDEAVEPTTNGPTIELTVPADWTIHQRLVAILGALPAIGKDQRNEQQKFMYRGHDDVMNALNPLLATFGVVVVPDVRERLVSTRTTSRDTTMYEVNLHVRYRFYGAAGDHIEASAWGEGTDMGDKSTNKAMTMAFKNVLAQVFAISTAELSDADGSSPEETRTGGGGGAPAPAPRQEGRKRPEFDPGTMLAPGAINVRTEEDADAIRQALRDFDADQPWADIEAFLIVSLFEKPYDELDKAQKREFYTRLANSVIRIGDIAGPGDFPPPSTDQIAEGLAWAFKGIQVALVAPVPPSDGEPDSEPAYEETAPEDAVGGDDGPAE